MFYYIYIYIKKTISKQLTTVQTDVKTYPWAMKKIAMQ